MVGRDCQVGGRLRGRDDETGSATEDLQRPKVWKRCRYRISESNALEAECEENVALQVSVARPKNRGGNTSFDSDAPVFMTAPQEVALYCGKRRDEGETR